MDNKQQNIENNENTKNKEILNKDKNNDKRIFSTLETILLVITSLFIGLSIGILVNKKIYIQGISGTTNKYINEFIKNYQFIIDNYYEELNEEDLIHSAIEGMMESLDDPHSIYMDESESNNFSITLDGSYKGLGIQITKDNATGYMLVTAVFKNSPAATAGVLAGDRIISMDGAAAKDMTTSEFSNIVLNSNKTSFEMKILREEEEINITVDKKIVTLESVLSKTYYESSKKIGYIYIGIFANNSYDQFKTEFNKLKEENIDYLIIDVRGNNGGHLTTVDNILDLFLGSKQIMYQFEQNGKTTAIYGEGKENYEFDIILLGDETSASASEVLIAGLRDNFGSIFIGKKTYGKGTAQELMTLSDGTQYKITVKKWLTPKGNWIEETSGITPDIEIELDSKYYKTGLDEDDTQLQAAINYIIENK